MRIIVINAERRFIEESILTGTLAEQLVQLQKIVGGFIEKGFQIGNDVIYVNDEGRINGTNYGFAICGEMQVGKRSRRQAKVVLCGNGVIVGQDGEGNDVDCTMGLIDSGHLIDFVSL